MSLSGKLDKVADGAGVWGPLVAKAVKAIVQRIRRRSGKPAPKREAYVDPTAAAIAKERAAADAQYGGKP